MSASFCSFSDSAAVLPLQKRDLAAGVALLLGAAGSLVPMLAVCDPSLLRCRQDILLVGPRLAMCF